MRLEKPAQQTRKQPTGNTYERKRKTTYIPWFTTAAESSSLMTTTGTAPGMNTTLKILINVHHWNLWTSLSSLAKIFHTEPLTLTCPALRWVACWAGHCGSIHFINTFLFPGYFNALTSPFLSVLTATFTPHRPELLSRACMPHKKGCQTIFISPGH